MWHRIKDLWTHNRLLLLVFLAVVALSGFFGVRFTVQLVYWSDPARQNQTLAEWMTPRYVARSYDIPPEVVKAAWGLDPDSPLKRASLERIAAEIGLTLDEMQERITQTAATWHQGKIDE